MAKSLVSQEMVDNFISVMSDNVRENIINLGVRTLLTRMVKKNAGYSPELANQVATGEINIFARPTAPKAPKVDKRLLGLASRYAVKKLISGELDGTQVDEFINTLMTTINEEMQAQQTSPTLDEIKKSLA